MLVVGFNSTSRDEEEAEHCDGNCNVSSSWIGFQESWCRCSSSHSKTSDGKDEEAREVAIVFCLFGFFVGLVLMDENTITDENDSQPSWFHRKSEATKRNQQQQRQ